MAEADYLNRKRICENIIASDAAHEINYMLFQGSMSDPLFFGRAGIFLHQFNKPKKIS